MDIALFPKSVVDIKTGNEIWLLGYSLPTSAPGYRQSRNTTERRKEFSLIYTVTKLNLWLFRSFFYEFKTHTHTHTFEQKENYSTKEIKTRRKHLAWSSHNEKLDVEKKVSSVSTLGITSGICHWLEDAAGFWFAHSDFLFDCHCFRSLSGTFSSWCSLVSAIAFIVVINGQEYWIITKLNLNNRTCYKLY